MKYEVYKGVVASKDFNQFDFVSHGKKGPICKRVAFTMTEMDKAGVAEEKWQLFLYKRFRKDPA